LARLKNRLIQRVQELLLQKFPPPDSIKLEEHDGIIGVITSKKFAGMESLDRQSLIGDLVDTQLSPEERRRVLVIVGVTPDEGDGYLAGADKNGAE
jgi:hypothetical protein